jgi:hypothetical protein
MLQPLLCNVTLSAGGADDVAAQMIERAAALLLGGMGNGAVADAAITVDEQVSIGPYLTLLNISLEH